MGWLIDVGGGVGKRRRVRVVLLIPGGGSAGCESFGIDATGVVCCYPPLPWEQPETARAYCHRRYDRITGGYEATRYDRQVNTRSYSMKSDMVG